jgi:DNA-directed RNA polymerase subunit RPC12/RpoP
MPAAMTWRCSSCGTGVTVAYEMNGSTSVRCPNSKCSEQHSVQGKISGMWIQQDGDLQPVDFAGLIIPGSDS